MPRSSPTSGHGGKRLGAGRKPTLDKASERRVGRRCEREQQRLAHEAVVEAATEAALAREPTAAMKESLLEFIKEEGGHIEAFEEALRSAKRSKGFRKRVIAEAATWASATFQKRVSIHKVERCWKLFRSGSS